MLISKSRNNKTIYNKLYYKHFIIVINICFLPVEKKPNRLRKFYADADCK